MQNFLILIAATLLFQLSLASKFPNQWIRALISSFTAALVLLIIHTIIDGAVSNLWPFVFIIYMPPAYIIATFWHYIFKLTKGK